MKEKQYLISESELMEIYTNGYSDGTYSNPLDYRKKDFLKSKQPVSTLDRDKVGEILEHCMRAWKGMSGIGKHSKLDISKTADQICSLAVQPEIDKKKEIIMLKAIKAYQRMVNAYRVGEKELPEWVFENIGEFKATCKKGDKE
jgi:hypothetical protein